MHQILSDILTGFRTFTLSNWAHNLIAPVPNTVWYFEWLYLGLLGLFLIAALVMSPMPMHGPYKNRWLSFFFGNIAIGILLWFFRTQHIPYLGMDLLRFFHELGMVIWLNSIIWYRRTEYRQHQLQKIVIDRRAKYLPKPKR